MRYVLGLVVGLIIFVAGVLVGVLGGPPSSPATTTPFISYHNLYLEDVGQFCQILTVNGWPVEGSAIIGCASR